MEPHHRFLLAKQLAHIDFLEEQIEDLSAEIARRVETLSNPSTGRGTTEDTEAPVAETTEGQKTPLTWAEAVALLDTIPGVDERTAEVMLAEMGIDMSQFPTEAARQIARSRSVTLVKGVLSNDALSSHLGDPVGLHNRTTQYKQEREHDEYPLGGGQCHIAPTPTGHNLLPVGVNQRELEGRYRCQQVRR